ncbi:hypothetical protein LUZ61_012029 [Rhynchospora tenuis]|uniref:SKP1-like protein n=1 Tax=Rhynchospora tenuis TaxID=198213 RepID=A0AAD6F0W6_9POAL|nr:hypothetical protein LUZ61_012029 [Rhynchospora tenuis]
MALPVLTGKGFSLLHFSCPVSLSDLLTLSTPPSPSVQSPQCFMMEPIEGNSFNKDLEEKLSLSTSGDDKSSKNAELGSITGFVVLKCENNEEVSVPIALAIQSGLIRNTLDAGFADVCIPIPTVPASVLKRMMEYWKMHVGQAGFSEERCKDVHQWEEEFFTRIGPDALFDLLVVANYMDAQDVVERGTDYVAEFVKKSRVDEIRAYLGMKNDFTPEEERQLKKDFPWSFEEDIH